MNSVLCINLKRRIDKRGAFVGAMRVMGVPEESIRFFDAHDGMEYESRYDIAEQASKEFPFWDNLKDDWVSEHGEAGTMCAQWSYQSCLKIIAEQPESDRVFLMFDHTLFVRFWAELLRLLSLLGNFHAVQMEYSPYLTERFDKGRLPHHKGINYGIAGAGDCCVALSPAGAQKALELYEREPYWNTTVFWEVVAKQSDWVCYSVKNPDDWVLRPIELYPFTGLPDSERELINKIKGSAEIAESHFYKGKRFSELEPEHFMGRRGEPV